MLFRVDPRCSTWVQIGFDPVDAVFAFGVTGSVSAGVPPSHGIPVGARIPHAELAFVEQNFSVCDGPRVVPGPGGTGAQDRVGRVFPHGVKGALQVVQSADFEHVEEKDLASRTRIQLRDFQRVEEDAAFDTPGGQGHAQSSPMPSRSLSHGVEVTQGRPPRHLFVGNRISADCPCFVRGAEPGSQPPGVEGMAPRGVGPEDPPHVVRVANEYGVVVVLRTRVQSLDGPAFTVEIGVQDLMLHLFPDHQGLPAPADDTVSDISGSGPGNIGSGTGEVVPAVEVLGEIGKLVVEEEIEAFS